MSESAISETSLVGQNIDGRYRLEEQLGTGTQGVTYRARHLEHQRVVALKLLHEDVSGDALRRGRFEWEAATLAALGHPNIVTLVDYGVHEGRRWIAGEWLEGETLQARIARSALPLPVAMTIVRQLLAALASAHAARLVHRNLKPSNVFLERRTAQGRERVKLLDFAPATRVVRGTTPVALPAELLSPYSPPELAAGELLDARGDVYAVGATLIGMLSGEDPFDAMPTESVDGARPSSPDRMRALPGVDATLMAWIRRATASQRTSRFADAADMLRELIDLLPRDLRSPPDSSDGTSRAVTMPISRPPPLPQVRPAAVPPPLPSMRASATPPPLPRRRKTGEVSLPPPPAVPVEVKVTASSEFRTVFQKPVMEDELPGDVAPAEPVTVVPPIAESVALPGARSEIGRGTLRPIESKIVAASAEPRLQQLMAAGVFGAFLIAVVVIFLQPGGEDRASTSAARPAVAAPAELPDPMERKPKPPKPVAPVTLDAKPSAPVKLAAGEPKSSVPSAVKSAPAAALIALPNQPPGAAAVKQSVAAPRASAPSIVAAPGRPPVRDPWQEQLPPELKRVRELALNGAPGDEDKIKMLREYNRDHPRDVRGYLLISHFFANRLWRTDAVEELQRALEKDITVRGAPEILPTLLDMVAQGKAQPLAEKLVLQTYGSEALDSIEAAFDDVKKPGDAARLHSLRLKITGGAPQ